MTTRGLEIAGIDGGRISLSAQQLQNFDARLEGDLLGPGDEGWDDAVETWNAMVAKTPALVARPVSARDVSAAVTFAREHGVLLGIKGGGHNIAGTSMAEDGLTLDMSRMRDVTVDPDPGIAHVGPGCLLRHVDGATQEHRLVTPLGFVSETGLAGLTLGGGWGYLTRRYGWTVDNLEEVEIVTADGEIRVANGEGHPDLFWAIRGGGGNFGVVTRFTFRLHEMGPTITGGLRVWSADRAQEVLAAYADLTASAPRELTAACTVRLAPPAPFLPEEWHGKPITSVIVCHSGPNPDADLAPLRDLGDPIADVITEKPYVERQSMLDAMEPKGVSRYWKTEFLAGIGNGFLDAFREGALQVKSPLSQSVIFHLDGELNERAPDDGAVGNREARFISGFSGTWPPDKPADPHIDWVRSSWERIRPYSTGGNYVNFQLADDDPDRTADAYLGNYERLQRIKAEYDPENLFRVNRNIPPAA